MKNIKRYNQFVNGNKNKNISQYYKDKMILLSDIKLNESDSVIMFSIVEKLYKNLSIKDKEKLDILLEKNTITLKDTLNESFWDKLTSRVDKASNVSNVLPDESESILKKLIRKAGEAMNFIKKLVSSFKDFISNIISSVKDKVVDKLKTNDKFKEKVKKIAHEDNNGFIKDLKVSKSVYKFYKTDFLGGLLDNFKKSLSNFFTKEQTPIPESLNFDYLSTNEGKNVLSTMIHGIEKIPPFSWLHKVAHMGEKGANGIIKGLSLLTDKLGGPKFVLPTIAILLGVAFEYKIKGAVKHGILSVLGDAFTGGLLSVISWIATFIAAIIVIDEISGNLTLGEKENKH